MTSADTLRAAAARIEAPRADDPTWLHMLARTSDAVGPALPRGSAPTPSPAPSSGSRQ